MKKIVTLALILLWIGPVTAQFKYGKKDPAHYFYTNLSVDANMAFGLKDNSNTAAPDRGFDWDLEVGVRADEIVGVYIFYGRFNEFDYQNYGAGVDVYIQPLRDFGIDLHNPFNGKRLFKVFDGIEASIGAYYSAILRKDGNGNWASGTSWISPKAQIIFWNGDLGFTLSGKFQGRPELGKRVFEGQFGLTLKFDR